METEERDRANREEQDKDRLCVKDSRQPGEEEGEQDQIPYKEFIMHLRRINLCLQKQCTAPMGEITSLMTIQEMCRQEGRITASELGRKMRLSRPAVSRMIHTLKRKGYIEFYPGKDDHRYLYMTLTDQGSKLIYEEMKGCMRLIHSAVEKMGREDMDRFLYYSGRFSGLIAAEEPVT